MSNPRTIIRAAIKNDIDALTSGIQHLYHCRDVMVDIDGSVWIADPHQGRWLDDDDLGRIARALREGLI